MKQEDLGSQNMLQLEAVEFRQIESEYDSFQKMISEQLDHLFLWSKKQQETLERMEQKYHEMDQEMQKKEYQITQLKKEILAKDANLQTLESLLTEQRKETLKLTKQIINRSNG